MITVNATYKRRFLWWYWDATFTRHVPENWREMPRKTFARVAELLYADRDDGVRGWCILLRILRPPFLALRDATGHGLDPLVNELEYLSTAPDFGESLYERYGIMRGPGDELQDITADEFAHAEHFCDAFIESRSKKDLRQFIGCLYRFPYCRFHRWSIGWWAFWTRLIPYHIQCGMLMNYQTMRGILRRQYPLAFSEKDNGGRNYGWMGIMADMAGPKLGTVNKVQRQLLHNVLIIMQRHGETNVRNKNDHGQESA